MRLVGWLVGVGSVWCGRSPHHTLPTPTNQPTSSFFYRNVSDISSMRECISSAIREHHKCTVKCHNLITSRLVSICVVMGHPLAYRERACRRYLCAERPSMVVLP